MAPGSHDSFKDVSLVLKCFPVAARLQKAYFVRIHDTVVLLCLEFCPSWPRCHSLILSGGNVEYFQIKRCSVINSRLQAK